MKAREDLEATRDNADTRVRELRIEKEGLTDRICDRKEEARRLRVEGGGGSDKTPLDIEVENNLKGIDNLLLIKVAELKREKARYEGLKNNYEDKAFDDMRNKLEASKKHDNDNDVTRSIIRNSHISHIHQDHNKLFTSDSKVRSILGFQNSDRKEYQPHHMPNVSSEVVQTQGSRFLDEFNRDIQRLLYKD